MKRTMRKDWKKEKSCHPVLRLSSGTITLLDRHHNLAEAMFALPPGGSFCAQYNPDHAKVERYTLVSGAMDFEHNGQRMEMKIGETVDASLCSKVITFYALSKAEVMIHMDAPFYERNFFEMQLLQREMDAVAQVDGYTYHHCDRIRQYAIEVWKKFDRPAANLKLMRWGAYFHDIGKLAIPSDILNKPGSLTAEEWDIMKSHSQRGADMLRNHPVEWLREAAYIVEQHHERFDGKGYPFGLKGEEISLEASIVSVVDAFDAMTTDRVYKEAMPLEEALNELIKGKGIQFHPAVVDVFVEYMKEQAVR
ncbi:HD-GYP domain-containing protein [Sporosarcina sp. Te-1]|uniref:HD-GYP domain-containing protein n=1 Tax=Sporosarcina sp. Te-1 TaxID=2818390 RepID=UPI001A9E4116|nr:HD-GYP domain-containing protein [Sporosarcina sp. Te-1]QTD39675.1 HD-GYP domain-containing protein [Sporosarcina sp. Te-1]